MLRIFFAHAHAVRNSFAKHFSFSGSLEAVVAATCALCVHVRSYVTHSSIKQS